MAKGVAVVTVGGVKRTVRVELGLALEVEAETNSGTMALAHDFARGLGKFGTALDILRLALARQGVRYTPADMLELAQHDGIGRTMSNAAIVLNALFDRPDTAGKRAAGSKQTDATDPADENSQQAISSAAAH